jgi:hypothetical protein
VTDDGVTQEQQRRLPLAATITNSRSICAEDSLHCPPRGVNRPFLLDVSLRVLPGRASGRRALRERATERLTIHDVANPNGIPYPLGRLPAVPPTDARVDRDA